MTGRHHQPRQGGVADHLLHLHLPLLLPPEVLVAAVLTDRLPVPGLRADHHEEPGVGLLPAGERQPGGGAGQPGPEGGGPALVAHCELLGGVRTPGGGGGQVRHEAGGAHQQAAALPALALRLHSPHWVVAGATTGVTSSSSSSSSSYPCYSTVIHALDRDLTRQTNII